MPRPPRQRRLPKALTFLAGLALAGCLISEEPLLDASNGSAKPLRPGAYMSCSYKDGDLDEECARVDITRDATREHRMVNEDGEVILMRFRRFARRAYLTQLIGENEDSYSYFYATGGGRKLELVLINCEDLPAALRDALVEAGEMDVEHNGAACEAKTLNAAVKAAGAYRKGAAAARYVVKLTPAQAL